MPVDHAEGDGLIRDWFARALAAVDPAVAVTRSAGRMRGLAAGRAPVVLAIGKAAGAMMAGVDAALPHGVARGVVVTKDMRTVPDLPASVLSFEAGHPVPDERSIAATSAALAMLESSSPDDPVVVVISGGGSALFEAPAEGVTLGEIAALTRRMLDAGATINELNAVRGRLSRVKQGGLLGFIADVRPTTLVLSDVIGNDLSVIASGPTIAPRADKADPRSILERLGLWRATAPAVRVAVARPAPAARAGEAPGTIEIIADNDTAVDAFARAASGHGGVDADWRQRTGEARDLAVAWVDRCRDAPEGLGVLVGGGEATVTVHGGGVGGRNTEFAVAAALELDARGMDDWVIASLATDGDDGPTGAAGGIVSRRTVQAARHAGIDVEAALGANDTLRVLDAAGATVRTGPTGTNVNDLYVGVRVR